MPAIIKRDKPTSPARRQVIRVKHDHLHKGRPWEPLCEPKQKTGGRNNNGVLPPDILVAVINRFIASSILNAKKMLFLPRLSASSTILIVLPILHLFFSRMASVVIFLLLKV